jgi:hypothetical protein
MLQVFNVQCDWRIFLGESWLNNKNTFSTIETKRKTLKQLLSKFDSFHYYPIDEKNKL